MTNGPFIEEAWEIARTIAAVDKQLLSSGAVEAIAKLAAMSQQLGASEVAQLREKLAVAEAKIQALVAVVSEFCEEVKQLQTALELYRGAAEQRERKGIE